RNPLYHGDAGDLAPPVALGGLVAARMDRRRDLLADGADGQVHARHQAHRLQTGDGIARAVAVSRTHRAVVTGVHGLHQVKRLTATNLTDDNAVGAHTQGVDHEVADGDLTLAFNVGRAALQPDDVLLAKLD